MQAAELHKLKDKLSKSTSLHFNALDHPNGIKMHFSPPGDEYYSILQRNLHDYVIEYHTPTHIYTLNNCFEATLELHNQFRTIMSAEGIVVPVCAHEEHSMFDGSWTYNAWIKPVSDAKSTFELVLNTDVDNTATFNNFCTHAVSTLNVLAKQPQGSKVWPESWASELGASAYYRNANNEWYWKSPLGYLNRYGKDTNLFAENMFSWVTDANKLISLNPHIHRNADFHVSFISQLDSTVFDIESIID